MALAELLSKEDKDNFAQTSWEELRPDIIEVICQHLDQKKLFPTTDRVFRDFRGLFQKIKLNNTEDDILRNIRLGTTSPTKLLFTYMTEKEIELTVLELLENFEEMDRNDLIDKLLCETRSKSSISGVKEDKNMVKEDCDLAKEEYDAIVVSAGEDDAFVDDLIRRMSSCKLNAYSYNEKLQKQGGIFHEVRNEVTTHEMIKHDVRSILLKKRCKNVIAIFSPKFLSHSAYYFLLNDVLEKFCGVCKIIPIVWKECDIMNHNLKYLAKLRYTTSNPCGGSGGGFNFYERLFVTTLGASVPEDMKQEMRKYTFGVDEEMTSGKEQEVERNQIKKKSSWGCTEFFKNLQARFG